MRKNVFLFASILSLFTISFFYANFGSFSPSEKIIGNIAIDKLFEEKSLFYQGTSKECQRYGQSVINKCCNQENSFDPTITGVSTYTVQCEPPNEDISYEFECINKSEFEVGLSSTDQESSFQDYAIPQ